MAGELKLYMQMKAWAQTAFGGSGFTPTDIEDMVESLPEDGDSTFTIDCAGGGYIDRAVYKTGVTTIDLISLDTAKAILVIIENTGKTNIRMVFDDGTTNKFSSIAPKMVAVLPLAPGAAAFLKVGPAPDGDSKCHFRVRAYER